MIKTFTLESCTEAALPGMWEQGGVIESNDAFFLGASVIITGPSGERKTSIINTEKYYDQHALFIINKGNVVIEVYNTKIKKEQISLVRLWRINDLEKTKYNAWRAYAKLINSCIIKNKKEQTWNKPLDERFQEAINIAIEKSEIEACQQAVYFKSEKKTA